MELKTQEKVCKLPEVTIEGVRKMTKYDIDQVHILLMEYLKKFYVHLNFSKEEVEHMILPKENIVNSYVIEDHNKKITDFISFYLVPCLSQKAKKEYLVDYI